MYCKFLNHAVHSLTSRLLGMLFTLFGIIYLLFSLRRLSLVSHNLDSRQGLDFKRFLLEIISKEMVEKWVKQKERKVKQYLSEHVTTIGSGNSIPLRTFGI